METIRILKSICGGLPKRTVSLGITVLYLFVVFSVNFLHTCGLYDQRHPDFHKEGTPDHEESNSSGSRTKEYCPACKFLDGNQSPTIDTAPPAYLTQAVDKCLSLETNPYISHIVSVLAIRAPPSFTL